MHAAVPSTYRFSHSTVTQCCVLARLLECARGVRGAENSPACRTREASGPHSMLQCEQHRTLFWSCSASQWPSPAYKAQPSPMRQRT